MIMGKDSPDSGSTIVVGETVNMVGVGHGQERMDELDSTKTVFQEVTHEVDELELGQQRVQSRDSSYVSWFCFKGAMQQVKVCLLYTSDAADE